MVSRRKYPKRLHNSIAMWAQPQLLSLWCRISKAMSKKVQSENLVAIQTLPIL